MAAPISRNVVHAEQFGRLWWLPPGGCGNGLDDSAWIPALEISEQVVADVLGRLREASVPAYAAPARPAWQRLREPSGRPEGCRLWVGASGYGRAESVLMTIMPGLVREAALRADSAWR